MGILSIQTERLEIRNMKASDLDDFHAYRSNPAITQFQSFDVMDREQAKRFIEEQQDKAFGKPEEWVQYAIENKSTRKLIGDCAIRLQHDTRMAEIGITVSHVHQREGYAKETLRAIAAFLFNVEDFHRIVELVDTRNEASIRLLESMGFRREGHFAQSYFDNGVWTDEFQYAMLRHDWKKPQQ